MPDPDEKAAMPDDSDANHGKRRSNLWYWLLVIPLIALLYPPWYAHVHPMLGGVPFFIWYQFAWVFGAVATTVTVSWLTD